MRLHILRRCIFFFNDHFSLNNYNFTGDNILTAIHIAQESGMFQQCANVYRILTENQNNGTTVHKEVRYDLLDQSKSKKEKSVLFFYSL